MSTIDIGIKIDLEKLISSRLLVQASSGGGKSYAIRKLAEVCMGNVQVIIVDIEGEFVTLREKYPFALVSKVGGDIPLNINMQKRLPTNFWKQIFQPSLIFLKWKFTSAAYL